jgi:hypothetical protein
VERGQGIPLAESVPPKKLTLMLDFDTPLSICKNLRILPAPFNGPGTSSLCDARGLDRLMCSGTGAAGRREVELNLSTNVCASEMNRLYLP